MQIRREPGWVCEILRVGCGGVALTSGIRAQGVRTSWLRWLPRGVPAGGVPAEGGAWREWGGHQGWEPTRLDVCSHKGNLFPYPPPFYHEGGNRGQNVPCSPI